MYKSKNLKHNKPMISCSIFTLSLLITSSVFAQTTTTRATLGGQVDANSVLRANELLEQRNATKLITKDTKSTALRFGNFNYPFAANSPWNVRPIQPTFSGFEIPKSSYFPSISAGAYSTAAFLAKPTDAPMVVYGRSSQGVWNPDAEKYQPSVTIPHWPADTVPATGSDGHADIVDEEAGIIHSFWQLKQVNGKWTTQLYAWMPLKGRGWADPAHYYQGGRAVGIPSIAGVIRKHEVDDGKPTYEHALALSLTYNALSPNPTYVYPATSADGNAATVNYGQIPEGALLMLPSNYDSSKVASPALKKVIETLKKYGAYVVDRNDGTPFAIYVENGSTFKLSNLAWDNAVAAELQKIRGSLKQVTGASSWLDGDGKATPSPLVAPKDLNVLSLRGTWTKISGDVVGTFDSMTQSLVFPVTKNVKTVMNNYSGRTLSTVYWSQRQPGTEQKFSVKATGGATLAMTVYSGSNVVLKTANLGNNESVRFIWPTGGSVMLTGTSGLGQASTVTGQLINVTQ